MCCNHHNSYRKVHKCQHEGNNKKTTTTRSNNNCKSAVSEITDTSSIEIITRIKHTINDNYDYCCSTNCLEVSQVVAETEETTSSSIVSGKRNNNNSNNIRTMESVPLLSSSCRMCCRCRTRNTLVEESDTIMKLRNKSNYSRLLCYLVQNNKHYYYHSRYFEKQEDQHPLNSNNNETQLNFRANSSNNGFKLILLILLIITSFCTDLTTAEISHPRRQFNQLGQQHHSYNSPVSYNTDTGSPNTRKILPTFLKVPDTVEVAAGQTVILSCKVANLDDRMVLWMRASDLTVLTMGDMTFTQDRRFSSEYPHGGENSWGLIIKNVQHSDAGRYECQLNTEPKMKRYVNLVVKEQQQMDTPFYGIQIFGSKEQVVKPHNSVTLTCKSNVPETKASIDAKNNHFPSKSIAWSRNGELLTEKMARGGILIEIEHNSPIVISKLTLANVVPSDSGIYSCTSGTSSEYIELHVLEGEKQQTLLGSYSTCATLSPFLLLILSHQLMLYLCSGYNMS